jgi:hypothetical protein
MPLNSLYKIALFMTPRCLSWPSKTPASTIWFPSYCIVCFRSILILFSSPTLWIITSHWSDSESFTHSNCRVRSVMHILSIAGCCCLPITTLVVPVLIIPFGGNWMPVWQAVPFHSCKWFMQCWCLCISSATFLTFSLWLETNCDEYRGILWLLTTSMLNPVPTF